MTPIPDTRCALLPSAGYASPRATKHHYTETRECIVPGPDGGPAYEYIFICEETGEERRWGLVERKTPTKAKGVGN